MADLYNRKERRIERNIPDSDVQAKVSSGVYDFLGGPDAKIYLNTGDGVPTIVPANTAASYIEEGAQYLTPVMVQQMRENEEFADSALGSLSAVAAGADQYLFAGGGAHVLEAMNLIPEGRVESVQAASPWINHGTGVVASILAALGTVGGSAKAQAAAHGTKGVGVAATKLAGAAAQQGAAQTGKLAAAKSIAASGYDTAKAGLANYTLPGIGARLGRAAEGKANQYFMQQGNKFIPQKLANAELSKRFGPHVAKMASATIGAGIEGGVWGTGAGISEAIIGAPEESAEHLLDAISTNVLLGMAFGGTISGLTPFLAGTKGLAANMADKFLDFSGKNAERATQKFSPYITEVAKAQGLPEETVEWLRKASMGEVDLIKDLDDFVKNLNGSAAEVAKTLDLLRITDQFIQISDIQGLKMDSLIDAVQATMSGRALHHNIGSVFDGDTALQGLKQSREAKSLAFRKAKASEDPAIRAQKDRLLEEMDEIDSKIAAREKELRADSRTPHMDESYTLPDDIEEVLGNTAESYQRTRVALAGIIKRSPDANAGGRVENLIRAVNEREASLYEHVFGLENLQRVKDRIRAKSVSTAPKSSELRLADKLTERIEAMRVRWAEKPPQSFEDALKAAEAKGYDPANIRRNIDATTLKNAFDSASQSGELSWLAVIASEFPEGKARSIMLREFNLSQDMGSFIFGRTKHAFEKFEDIFRRRDTLDATEEMIDGLGFKFSELRDAVKKTLGAARSVEITDRLGLKVTDFAEQGFLDYLPKDAKPGARTLRTAIREAMLGLDHRVFDPIMIAQAFKSLEDIQTTLLKSLQYGKLPQSVAVTEVIEEHIIKMLREEMKDRSRWGQMSKLKENFDDASVEFSKYSEQIVSGLTGEVGIETLGDPQAFLSLIRNLDNHTVDLMLKKIHGYGDSGRNLLDFIRRNFDPVEPNKLPVEMRGAIEKRLKAIDDVGFKMSNSTDIVGLRHVSWDDRLGRMHKYSRNTSDRLSKQLEDIREKLPIADAMLANNARGNNLGLMATDLGRGGIVSALTHAVTGSKLAAGVAGSTVGISSMALDPAKYLGLMRQLGVLHKANKEMIKKYMADWAENTVPQAAITKGWEKTSRSMFMIAGQPTQRDKRETRSEIRRKAAQSSNIESWSGRIMEALDAELTPDSYFETSASIEKLASSPFLMERFTNETTKIFEQMPDIRNAMKAVLQKKVNIASKLMPKINHGPLFSDPVAPSDFQLQEFARHLQVLNSPKDTILTAMLTGTLTVDMVTTLKEAWPKIYGEIVQAAMESISDPEVRNGLNQTQRLALSTLTGVPIMELSESTRLFQAYSQEGGEKGRGAPRGPGGGGMRDTVGAPGAGTMGEILAR